MLGCGVEECLWQGQSPLQNDNDILSFVWEIWLHDCVWVVLLRWVVLCCILHKDGMDQSKWCLPRDRIVQSSKEGSVFQRPRMKVHGVWNHGVSLNLFLIHPGVAADSSLVIETFQRVLQDTVQTFEKCGRPLPSACCIWVPWNVHSSDSCACVFHCLLVDCERSG